MLCHSQRNWSISICGFALLFYVSVPRGGTGGRVSVTNRFFPSLPPLRFPIQIKERPLSHTAFKETMRDQERSSVQQDSARRSIASWQKMSGWLFSAVTMLLISFRSKQSKSIKCKKYWTGPLKRMGYELPSGNWCLIRCLL